MRKVRTFPRTKPQYVTGEKTRFEHTYFKYFVAFEGTLSDCVVRTSAALFDLRRRGRLPQNIRKRVNIGSA
jgi:hypothetical protein